MKRNVHIIDGQFRYLTSVGMHNFGESLNPKGFNVTFWGYGQSRSVALALAMAQPGSKNAIVGYSNGACAGAWVANDPSKPQIDLLVAYDPGQPMGVAPLSAFPIGPNVKRAICYRQTGFLLTSMFVGRGYLRAAPDGPKIEEHQFIADHLYVPYMQSLHDRTLKALEGM